MTREVKVHKLLAPQTLSAAATVESSVVYIAEHSFDIVLNSTVTAGSIAVLSVIVAEDASLTNAVEVTDLERFVKNDVKSATTALAQTTITTANSGNITRVSFVSPYAGKPYIKVRYAVTGGSVDMQVFSVALNKATNYPVVQ